MSDEEIIELLLNRVFNLKFYKGRKGCTSVFVFRGDSYAAPYLIRKVRERGIDAVVDSLENPWQGSFVSKNS